MKQAIVIGSGAFMGAVISQRNVSGENNKTTADTDDQVAVEFTDIGNATEYNYNFETETFSLKPPMPIVIPVTLIVDQAYVVQGIPTGTKISFGDELIESFAGGDIELSSDLVGALHVTAFHYNYLPFSGQINVKN